MYNPRTNHQPTGVLNGLELWCILKNGFGWSLVKHSGARACRAWACGRHSLAAAFQFLGSEWRLYDYITRHFISSLMPDVEYDEKDFCQRWICGIIWVCSTHRWNITSKLMLKVDGGQRWTRSSVDISWQSFRPSSWTSPGRTFVIPSMRCERGQWKSTGISKKIEVTILPKY